MGEQAHGTRTGLHPSPHPAPSLHPASVYPPAHSYIPPSIAPVPRTEGKAVVAFVLGLLSVACVGAVTGLPAIILGAMARRDIDRSSGLLEGRTLAAGGIVSGLFGTGLGIVLLLWGMGAMFTPGAESTANVASPAVDSASNAPEEDAPPPTIASSAKQTPGTSSCGSVEVVDLDDSRPLRAQLTEIVGRSRGRTVILQTVARSSSACAAVAAALPDLRMQRALANVTLVHVDVDEYARDLAVMKVETRTAPWFYKLDANGTPTDAISADAWETNLPESMAPVLGKFVHRATPKRRFGR